MQRVGPTARTVAPRGLPDNTDSSPNNISPAPYCVGKARIEQAVVVKVKAWTEAHHGHHLAVELSRGRPVLHQVDPI